MLDLAAWREEHRCPLCGGPKEICQAPYGTFVYGAEPPARCMVTDALDNSRKAVRDADNPGALLHRPRVAPWGTSFD